MKKLFTKVVLAMALLVVGGGSAWAYEVPEGHSIKNVFLGTNNNGVVVPENFESTESLGSEWSKGNFNSIALGNVTEVALPEVNANASEMPTYVSGKTMNGYVRQGSTTGLVWASYTMTDAVQTGYLVFSGDFCAIDYKNNAIFFRLCDEDGNAVLTLNNNANRNNATFFQYAVGNSAAVNTSSSSKWNTYNSFRITDLVVDMKTGDVSFTLDYINGSDVRKQDKISGINIGTGKNVKSIQIGRYCVSSTNINTHIDNLSLYNVGSDAVTYVDYTVKYQDVNGISIKEDEVYNTAIVGEVYTAPSSDLNTFYSSDSSKKYVYKSGQNTSVVADATAANNVITLVFDTYNKYNYTVNAVDNSQAQIKTVATGSAYEDETPNVGYSKYIEKDGTWYETSTSYAVQVSSAENTKNITYAANNDVVAFAEIGTGSDNRYSGGGFAAWNSKLIDANLAAGIYNVGIYCVSNGSSGKSHRTEGIYVNDVEVATTDNSDGLLNFKVLIAENSNLFVRGKGSSNYADNIDYVVITKIADMPQAGDDVTTLFVANPSFETGDLTGWTPGSTDGGDTGVKENSNEIYTISNADGNYIYNTWGVTPLALSQTINHLPAGYYSLKALLASDQNNVITLACGGESVDATMVNKKGTGQYETVVFNVPTAGNVTINVTSNTWFKADDFTLTYLGEGHVFTTANAWGSLCLGFNAEVPAGVEVYYVSEKNIDNESNTGTLTLTQIPAGSVVPANEGIIVKNGTHTFVESTESPVSITNLLSGTTEATAVTANSVYVLNGAESTAENVRFSLFTGTEIPANKAYLPKEAVGGARSLRFVFEGETSGISNVTATANNDVYYNLAGQRVNAQTKGIVIMNGKKHILR